MIIMEGSMPNSVKLGRQTDQTSKVLELRFIGILRVTFAFNRKKPCKGLGGFEYSLSEVSL
jgi:hypothetical protein